MEQGSTVCACAQCASRGGGSGRGFLTPEQELEVSKCAAWTDQEYIPLPTIGQNFVKEAVYLGSMLLTSVGFGFFS